YYVGNQRVDIANLESILREKLANEAEPAVILHVDKSVPIEHAVKVMDVANRMKIKLVLATTQE
ncbi:MAG: ExbD/TolR family protein, partial [Bacteroidia bacterium]